MHHRIVILRVTLLLMAFHGVAVADIAHDWSAGQQAFRDGDSASALLYFESARDGGLDTPAVHYNIAVSQFRLQRYDEARQTFQLIANRFAEMRGLAEYNLGLVARRQGNTIEARRHFLRAYELSPNDRKIRVLASRRLRELEPLSRTTAARWTGAVGVRGGHDDNVALRDETGLPVGTTAESPMLDLFASIQGPETARNGLRLDGSAYVLRYFDADEFDQSQFRIGVLYHWRSRDWRIRAGAHAGAGTLGGDAFDRKLGMDVSALRYINPDASLDLRYTYDDVSDADSRFAGISGWRQQIEARYKWYRNGHRIQARAGLEANDRSDPGVSPDRTRLGVSYQYQPGSGIGYGAGIDFRRSRYDDLSVPREEDLRTLNAAVTYLLRSDWLILFELRQSDNDSTDDAFSYERVQATLGAIKIF